MSGWRDVQGAQRLPSPLTDAVISAATFLGLLGN